MFAGSEREFFMSLLRPVIEHIEEREGDVALSK
jgi:hypothetical protein